MEHIMRHNWWRRMWTLQEFVLAERPVIVVGANKILWDDLFQAAENTFFSDGACHEMERQDIKANDLVVNNKMPPDIADYVGRVETSVHLGLMYNNILEAHKSRMTFQLGFQDLDHHLFASDFLLKARMRQAKDPRDKLYGLYHILQACHYSLPEIDYSQAIEKIYEDVTFSLVSQSKSWWILSHLFRAQDASALELPSWVPDFCSQRLRHQGADSVARNPHHFVSQAIQWPHNHFYLER